MRLPKVGDTVKPGDLLFLIDQAGLVNEVESEVAGRIVAVYGKPGVGVEAGQVLFEIG
jgi:biotin carboxyl carrier protein